MESRKTLGFKTVVLFLAIIPCLAFYFMVIKNAPDQQPDMKFNIGMNYFIFYNLIMIMQVLLLYKSINP
jgi:hypothetical protein